MATSLSTLVQPTAAYYQDCCLADSGGWVFENSESGAGLPRVDPISSNSGQVT